MWLHRTWDQGEGDPPKHCYVKSSCAGAISDSNAISGSIDPIPISTLCDARPGWNCFHSDIKDGGIVPSAPSCCQACQQLQGCAAWTWNEKSDQHCWCVIFGAKPRVYSCHAKVPPFCRLKTDCLGLEQDPNATCGAASFPPPPSASPSPAPPQPPSPPPPDFHNGVSMGGWFVTGASETQP